MNTDDQIKLAQAQLIQHTAEQMGVDVNELSTEELAKFASYVLNESETGDEHTKIAEADAMGRFMARSFAEEQQKIAAAEHVQGAVSGALEDVANAWAEKVAAEELPFKDRALAAVRNYSGYGDIVDNYKNFNAADVAARDAARKRLAVGAGKAGLSALALGGLGYGAYRAMGDDEAKIAAMSDAQKARLEALKREAEMRKNLSPAGQTARAKAVADNSIMQLVKNKAKSLSGYDDITQGYKSMRSPELVGTTYLNPAEEGMRAGLLRDSRLQFAKGIGKAGLTAGVLGGLGYGAYRAMSPDEEAKVASLELAENYAAIGRDDIAYEIAKLAAFTDPTTGRPIGVPVGPANLESRAARHISRNLSRMTPEARAAAIESMNNAPLRSAAPATQYLPSAGPGMSGTEAELNALFRSQPDYVAPAAAPSTISKIKDFYTRDFTRGKGLTGLEKAKAYGLGSAKALGTAGVVGGLGYGAYRALGGGDDEAKVAGYEFAKLAEARAAEIMAANGIHPETFEAIEPAYVKIAHVVTPDDVYTYEEKVAALEFNQELDAAAAHILNSLGLV
jgi:hypothetical protein